MIKVNPTKVPELIEYTAYGHVEVRTGPFGYSGSAGKPKKCCCM